VYSSIKANILNGDRLRRRTISPFCSVFPTVTYAHQILNIREDVSFISTQIVAHFIIYEPWNRSRSSPHSNVFEMLTRCLDLIKSSVIVRKVFSGLNRWFLSLFPHCFSVCIYIYIYIYINVQTMQLLFYALQITCFYHENHWCCPHIMYKNMNHLIPVAWYFGRNLLDWARLCRSLFKCNEGTS
jgi:hypothetical protein